MCMPEGNPLFSAVLYLFRVIESNHVYFISNGIRQNSKHKKSFSIFILTFVVEFSKGIQEFRANALLGIWILNVLLTLSEY